VAARSLPGIFSAGSGHCGEQGKENEHEGTPVEPPADGKHGQFQLSSPNKLKEMQCYSSRAVNELWPTDEVTNACHFGSTKRKEEGHFETLQQRGWKFYKNV
jgi:hypothetical protein